MICLFYEDFTNPVALDEARSLPVQWVHMLPLPCVLRFQDRQGKTHEWTTDRDYYEMNKPEGVKKPSEYTLEVTSPHETVADYERRKEVRLVLVRLVQKEERKGEADG